MGHVFRPAQPSQRRLPRQIPQGILSQHLNQLRTAGILASEKQGMNVIYRIQDQRAAALLEAIREYYCGD